MTSVMVVVFLKTSQLATTRFITTLPTKSIPKLPSPTASERSNRASKFTSFVVYLHLEDMFSHPFYNVLYEKSGLLIPIS